MSSELRGLAGKRVLITGGGNGQGATMSLDYNPFDKIIAPKIIAASSVVAPEPVIFSGAGHFFWSRSRLKT